MAPMRYSGIRGKLIYDKNQKLKISWQASFKTERWRVCWTEVPVPVRVDAGDGDDDIVHKDKAASAPWACLYLPFRFSPNWKIWFKGTIYEICWPQPHTSLFSEVRPQVVTKRCRLSLLTNSALVIRVQMRGEGGGLAGSQPMSTAVHITWHGAQINFGKLPLYLTCVRPSQIFGIALNL